MHKCEYEIFRPSTTGNRLMPCGKKAVVVLIYKDGITERHICKKHKDIAESNNEIETVVSLDDGEV